MTMIKKMIYVSAMTDIVMFFCPGFGFYSPQQNHLMFQD